MSYEFKEWNKEYIAKQNALEEAEEVREELSMEECRKNGKTPVIGMWIESYREDHDSRLTDHHGNEVCFVRDSIVREAKKLSEHNELSTGDILLRWGMSPDEASVILSETMSCAWTIGRRWAVPKVRGKEELFCLELSLSSNDTGKTKCGEPIENHLASPDFWIVGTDVEAIKKEVCKKIDGLFQNIEADKAAFVAIREAGNIP